MRKTAAVMMTVFVVVLAFNINFVSANSLFTGAEEFWFELDSPSGIADINDCFWEHLKGKVEAKIKAASIRMRHKPKPGVMYKLGHYDSLQIKVNVLEVEGKIVFDSKWSWAKWVPIKQIKHRVIVWTDESGLGVSEGKKVRGEIEKTVLGQVDKFLGICAVWGADKTAETDEQKNGEQFVSSKNSKVFHRINCSSAKKIKDSNKVFYKSREAAVGAGKRPCKRCNP